MKVSEIMTKNVISVSPKDPLSSIARILNESRIHGVPVTNGKHLLGIITETDFFTKGDIKVHLPTYVDMIDRAGTDKKISVEFDQIMQAKAEDIMTPDCITVSPEDEVNKLISIIRENDIHTVPVTIGDVIVGVVTVADIIKLL